MKYTSKTIAKSFATAALPQLQLSQIKGGCCNGGGDQPPPDNKKPQNNGG